MSTYKRSALNRRTFLRGLGASMALPFFEAMIPRHAFAQGMEVPKRFCAFYVPNGIHMQEWTPDKVGRGWVAKEILKPMEAFREQMLVVTGLENLAASAMGDGPGDHARGTGTFLTTRRLRKTSGSDIRNGVSMDQVLANELQGKTRFPSLQLGNIGGRSTGRCDSGYSCAYVHNISWADENTPLPKLTDARQVFEYTFGGFDPNQSASAMAKRRALRKSVLDYVKEDTSSLKKQLGHKDNIKLEQYLEGVRQLEIRIEQDDQGGSTCEVPTQPPKDATFARKTQLMADLIATNFECDQTRVITYMLAQAGSGRSYENELGVEVSGGHHQLSHHQNDQAKFRKLIKIGKWEVEQFAYLVKALQDRTDIDGNTLLHNTLLFFSSEISDGNRHNHNNLPVLVAGRGGGAFRGGEHIKLEDRTPMASMFLTMLQTLGSKATSFGPDSKGPLSELLV